MSAAAQLNHHVHERAYHFYDIHSPTQHKLDPRLANTTLNTNLNILQQPKIDHHSMIPHLPHSWISLRLPHECTTQECPNTLNKYKVGHDIEEHLSYRWRTPHYKWCNLAWDDFNRVMKSNKKTTRSNITKLFHNQWSTTEREFCWNRNKSDISPLCNLSPESKHHVFQCTSDTAVIPRDTSTKSILAFLRSNNTRPLLYQDALDTD